LWLDARGSEDLSFERSNPVSAFLGWSELEDAWVVTVMSQEPNLGEQALDKVAELALTSQVDQVDQVAVDVRTDPIKLMQGKVDSVAISSEGMVLKPDLRATAVNIQTSAIGVNPIKAALGQIELTEDTQAQAQILLSENDLNQALSSDYLRSKLRPFTVQVQSQPVKVAIERMQLHLFEVGKVKINAELRIEPDQQKQISIIVKLFLQDDGYRIGVEILSVETEGIELNLVQALVEAMTTLLDLRNFELNEMALRLKELDVQIGKLLLRGEVQVSSGFQPV
jgi:LmeA-like phospholipid-binding